MAPLAHGADIMDKYIPVGCLQVILSPAESSLQQTVNSLSELLEWHHFGKTNAHKYPLLPQDVQKDLLSSHSLSPFSRLVTRKWIHLSLKLDPSTQKRSIVRVFVLPDDVDNKSVSRSDDNLRKARRQLMSRLDCSSATWGGNFNSSILLTPPSDDEDGPSLLELFNTIPSPDPSQQTIRDPDYAGAIETVMESDVCGLKTTLYPYQRRSVAVMLQREAEARRILDPRLAERRDHTGRKWYHDPVIGTVLREPRYYDSPRGGILAEEMGSGKTLMCLTLCLATQHMPARMPEEHFMTPNPVVRGKTRSLADMAAACVARSGTSWKPRLEGWSTGEHYDGCIEAIRRNAAFYTIRQLPRRRTTRFSLTGEDLPPSHVYLSHASLVIVPPNLLQQWKQEIEKHTEGLKVFICAQNPDTIPSVKELLELDLVLFSSTAFDQLAKDRRNMPDGTIALDNFLARIHFKRCIVDEGHRLGNSTSNQRLDLQAVLDCLHYTARWIVTGTPSKGLFGLDEPSGLVENVSLAAGGKHFAQSSPEQEKDDLRRLGAIAKHYLKVQPWAKVPGEVGETPAEWSLYVLQPKHSSKGMGRPESLKATLESLIIRHRLTDVQRVLPKVKEKIVYLDPCYQDTLVLNIFSMMIIFNSVQSQRADQDYLFHPGQRKSLDQLVSNLSQASFFGGSFFSDTDLNKAIDTAEKFLAEKKVPISIEDGDLLRQAISFGRLAAKNSLKRCANQFHEVPVMVQNFPFQDILPGVVNGWSLSDQNDLNAHQCHEDEPLCMSANLISTLQGVVKVLQRQFGYYDLEDTLRMNVSATRLARQGLSIEQKRNQDDTSESRRPAQSQRPTLAGNTQLGEDKSNLSVFSSRPEAALEEAGAVKGKDQDDLDMRGVTSDDGPELPEPYSLTQMVSTASAKLSYLVDQIVTYHRDEQILVFYENDSIAYYLAEVLEVLGIQHLIYAKGITQVLKAKYVAAFTKEGSKFRVMLMDIHQAAFGLNMQSASRIYFISPVFNRQVQAQAVGRAKRIGQSAKSVTVETLVLKGSMEELVVKRRSEMTQQELSKCRSVIDDNLIYEWIRNAKILPLPGCDSDTPPRDFEQMAKLTAPQLVFGRRFGRETYHEDKELENALDEQPTAQNAAVTPADSPRLAPRSRGASVSEEEPAPKRVRFAVD